MGRRRAHVNYFADDNALGFAKLLLRQRNNIVHPGHVLVPEIPLGSPDLDWLPIVGQMQWTVLSRDRRVPSRPVELKLYREHGVCSVWIGGKRGLPALGPAIFRTTGVIADRSPPRARTCCADRRRQLAG